MIEGDPKPSDQVSIQLVSPARGELRWTNVMIGMLIWFPFNWFPLREGNSGLGDGNMITEYRFHSIGFPCERGTYCHSGNPCGSGGRVSIQLVSPARGELPSALGMADNQRGFHSIGFPCERGTRLDLGSGKGSIDVSIQLVSPARGEPQHFEGLCGD